MKFDIKTDRKPRNEREPRKRKPDGDTARGDTGCIHICKPW